MLVRSIFFIFIFIFSSIYSEEQFISNHSIHKSIETMLEYHVEYKKFSPMLAKRSFKLFVEQFDPYKMYLLDSEVTPFLRMKDKDLENVVKDHKMENYSTYESLNRIIQDSISRSREIRKSLRTRLLSENLSMSLKDVKDGFPRNVDELKEKIYKKLVSFLIAEKKIEEVADFSEEERNRLLDLWEVRLMRSEKTYLEDRGTSSLSLHILKSFAKSLDSHSSFFSEEEAYDLKTSLEKQFEGIGIVIREGVRGIVIKSLIKNSPAEKSGSIQKGDVLLSIDNESIVSLSYEEVLTRLKGKKGQKLFLKLRRDSGSQQEIIDVKIVREKIVMEDERVQFSTTRFGSGVIGKIEIPSFYEGEDGISSVKDLKQAISEIRKEGPLLGLVLDMRENSGGFLSQAVKVASLFMSGGIVVVSKYCEDQMQYLRNTDGKIFYDGPLVILTSKASASAAEIVAQALQDYGIALIVGDRRTYGKGTIQYQTVTGKSNSSFFKVTVGKYYTVSGRSTQIEGVHADIQVPSLYAPFNIGEKYLLYPLKNDQISALFTDPLQDVSPKTRSWMKKNYIPHLQKKLSFWTECLPILKKNSAYRIQNDKEFSVFLKALNSKKEDDAKEILAIESDIQMIEAVQIVKDMIFLDASKKNDKNFRKGLQKRGKSSKI